MGTYLVILGRIEDHNVAASPHILPQTRLPSPIQFSFSKILPSPSLANRFSSPTHLSASSHSSSLPTLQSVASSGPPTLHSVAARHNPLICTNPIHHALVLAHHILRHLELPLDAKVERHPDVILGYALTVSYAALGHTVEEGHLNLTTSDPEAELPDSTLR